MVRGNVAVAVMAALAGMTVGYASGDASRSGRGAADAATPDAALISGVRADALPRGRVEAELGGYRAGEPIDFDRPPADGSELVWVNLEVDGRPVAVWVHLRRPAGGGR